MRAEINDEGCGGASSVLVLERRRRGHEPEKGVARSNVRINLASGNARPARLESGLEHGGGGDGRGERRSNKLQAAVLGRVLGKVRRGRASGRPGLKPRHFSTSVHWRAPVTTSKTKKVTTNWTTTSARFPGDPKSATHTGKCKKQCAHVLGAEVEEETSCARERVLLLLAE